MKKVFFFVAAAAIGVALLSPLFADEEGKGGDDALGTREYKDFERPMA